MIRSSPFQITSVNSYQLKWLDLKYCKSLTSIPKLPPNLQHFDAHGCCSLKTVSNPLACLTTTQQICSTFIFTNCNKLEMSAKKDISSFAQRKCQLLSDAQNCCNVISMISINIFSCVRNSHFLINFLVYVSAGFGFGAFVQYLLSWK